MKKKIPLSESHPDLAKEADGWEPATVTAGSGRKMAWRCSKNHSWVAAVYSRTSKAGNKCPYCSGKKIWIGFNDLKTTHTEIANEAYLWDPTQVSFGNNKKRLWRCSSNSEHIWEATPNKRSSGRGCPFCSGNSFISGKTDLKSKNPELAREAFGWDPTKYSFKSGAKVSWKCVNNPRHIWDATISHRANGTGCPFCSGKKIASGLNDLATEFPNLAKQAFSFDPTKYGSGSSKRLQWKCNSNENHIWSATINSRVRGSGCPFCSRKSVFEGENDLATLYPSIAKQAEGWDPRKVRAGSGKSQKWRCEVSPDHIWNDSPNNRVNGRGCPYCSGHKVLVGFNDLKTTHPEIASESFGWDPTKVSAGSNKLLSWKCAKSEKHVWKSQPNWRSKGNNCPFCSNRKIIKGENDLATLFPEIAKEAFGWNPRTVPSGSNAMRKWRCLNDSKHIWVASIGNRTRGTGCPSCAITGYDPNEPGYIYFVVHDKWEMFQIGITNNVDSRIRKHSKKGWEAIEIRGPMDGHLAQQWETAILRMLKAKGADLSNSNIAGKFDGYSEAWSKSTFEVSSIKELMKLTEEFEESRMN